MAPIQDPELVPQAVFTALGLQDHSSSWAVSTLSDYLADKRPLLILDNCEHVHDAAAVLAGTLLRACPDLRILATSRQALGVTGEVVIDVPTLSLPEDGDASPEALLRSDAVALFVERAGAVQQGFAVDAANAAAILSVCTHLDGIPLALELAAVRLEALGLDALDRGSLPGSGRWAPATAAPPPAADARGSDRLELSAPERARAAAVGPPLGVRRGFELDAAQAVCAGDGLEAEEIPELVGSLVEKSVLKRRQGDAADRFRLLEPLRQFGRERLASRRRDEAPRASSGLGRRAGREWPERTTPPGGGCSIASAASEPTSGAPSTSALPTGRGRDRASRSAATSGSSGHAQGPVSDVRRLCADLLESMPAATSVAGELALGRRRCWPLQDGDPSTARDGAEAARDRPGHGDAEIVGWALQARGYVGYVERPVGRPVAAATESLSSGPDDGSARFASLSCGHPAGRGAHGPWRDG